MGFSNKLRRDPRTAIIVGSGPNGLAAAVILADAGLSVTVVEASTTIGGGTRSAELILPGVMHDICSAVHPLAKASPFYHRYADQLTEHGLRFANAEIDMVHILDKHHSATLHTAVSRTADGFRDAWDRHAWRSTFGPLANSADSIADEFLRPMLHLPRYPLLFARFGINAGLPASWSAYRFHSAEARALFTGIAAHAFTPLNFPGSAASGTMLTVAGHKHGWPVAIGGSQAIADALTALLESLGGTVVTGQPVTEIDQVSDADIILLDTSVEAAASILKGSLPDRIARSWIRFRRGPAVAKVDYIIEGDVPWSRPDARKSGTVHLGGTSDQIKAAEKDCWVGRLPERPFTLVSQQYLADASRSVKRAGQQLNPLWAYAHVPAGWKGTKVETFELVTAQIEDVAPGFREQIIDWVAYSPDAIEAYNRNNIGGDISGGANDLLQLLARPRMSPEPYFTGVPGVYLCSSSTAPGGGVHFMSGMNAALTALRQGHGYF
ncbi:phytoene desaturase family protein [Corynebacterium pseudotuberculosis]|uniref:phytoene desaturase family protein n=1 Tax=Corynebacterium pseudotuberculosis TaxID=1719 RepID=UPI0009347F55|nr:NAD(P)/FAD-dependent oxidoreductase [Corynebacterium pseudotuberculosis]